MARLKTQQELELELAKRKRRDDNLKARRVANNYPRRGQRAGKQPRQEYKYYSIYYDRSYNVSGEVNAVNKFGAGNLNLGAQDLSLTLVPEKFDPARVRAVMGAATPITRVSALSGGTYIKYTPEWNAATPFTFTAPISALNFTGLRTSIRAAFDAVKTDMKETGRFTYIPEDPGIDVKGGADKTLNISTAGSGGTATT